MVTLSFVGALALALAGCQWGNSNGGVAVVDLDVVAKAAGRDALITEQVQDFAKEQEAKLQTLKSELEQQLTDANAKLGDAATAADKQAVNVMMVDARNQLARELGQARQSAQELRSRLVRDFALEIKPLAEQVAQARGLQVVLVKQPGLLSVAPEVDITTAVVQALSETAVPPSVTPPLVPPALPGAVDR